MPLALISLGGNLGDVPRTFDVANQALREADQIHDVRVAPVYRSRPMGPNAGGEFWNSVTVFETSLSPHQLLDRLQDIENSNGRVREVHWGPRTLDLDLILFGDQIIDTERLQVPHPHFFYRRFVVEPAVAIAAATVDPVTGKTMANLLEQLSRRPFRVVFENGAVQATAESVRQLMSTEFPLVEFEFCDSVTDSAEFNLGICAGERCSQGAQLSRFWIRLTSSNPVEEIRWILQAACGDIDLGFSRDS